MLNPSSWLAIESVCATYLNKIQSKFYEFKHCKSYEYLPFDSAHSFIQSVIYVFCLKILQMRIHFVQCI